WDGDTSARRYVLVDPAGAAPGSRGDAQVDDAGGQERPTHAEGGQEDEGQQQDAGGGTEGVQRIQLRDATADLVRAADHVSGRDGQRAAHEKCRKRDKYEPEHEACKRQEPGTGLEVRVRERIRRRTVLEDE